MTVMDCHVANLGGSVWDIGGSEVEESIEGWSAQAVRSSHGSLDPFDSTAHNAKSFAFDQHTTKIFYI